MTCSISRINTQPKAPVERPCVLHISPADRMKHENELMLVSLIARGVILISDSKNKSSAVNELIELPGYLCLEGLNLSEENELLTLISRGVILVGEAAKLPDGRPIPLPRILHQPLSRDESSIIGRMTEGDEVSAGNVLPVFAYDRSRIIAA